MASQDRSMCHVRSSHHESHDHAHSRTRSQATQEHLGNI
jgi:hypothetical protein